MRVDQFEKLVVHGFRLCLFSAPEGLGGAMAQMIFHQVARYAAQRFLNGSDLGDDVRAIAVFLDHFLQATDLPFDAAEAILISLLQVRVYAYGLASSGTRLASAICSLSAPILF